MESGSSDVDAEGKLNDLMNYSLLVIPKELLTGDSNLPGDIHFHINFLNVMLYPK